MLKLIILFFVFSIIFYYIYKYQKFIYTYYLTSPEELKVKHCKYNFPKEHHEKILSVADRITKILDEKKIDVWLGCGALLGYHRHKYMIPWDDDIDLECYEEDIDKILNILKNDCKDKSYKINISKIAPLFLVGAYTITYDDIKTREVELFIIRRKNKLSYNTGLVYRKLYPKDTMKSEYRNNFIKVSINNYKFKIPEKSIEYLDHMYPDWSKVAFIDPWHSNHDKTNKYQKIKKFDWPVDYEC